MKYLPNSKWIYENNVFGKQYFPEKHSTSCVYIINTNINSLKYEHTTIKKDSIRKTTQESTAPKHQAISTICGYPKRNASKV